MPFANLFSQLTDEKLSSMVFNHNPAFGYNSFEGFIEEDWVQALEQLISEKLNVTKPAEHRWKQSDDGMHVSAVTLYSLSEKKYDHKREAFRDFFHKDGSIR